MRGPHPNGGGWSEPRRRRADWTPDLAPDASNGQPQNGHKDDELFPARPWDGGKASRQPWDTNPPASRPWGVQPSPSQPWGADPSPGLPRGGAPAPNLPQGDAAAPSQPWGGDAPAPSQPRGGVRDAGQLWGARQAPSQPWGVQPSPDQAEGGSAPASGRSRSWTADPSPGLPQGGEQPASRPWAAGLPSSLPRGAEVPPSQPWSSGDSPGPPPAGEPPVTQLWAADPSPGQSWGVQPANGQRQGDEAVAGATPPSLSELWGVQPIQSKALELAPPSRAERLAATPAYQRLGAPAARLRGNSRMTLLIAIPLVVSLLLLVTAGPGRILPRKTAEDSAKRPAAATGQPGDLDRLVTLVNQERARNGLPGMRVLRRLNAVATAHSTEMARQKRIHPDPDIAASAKPATSVSQYVDCASNIDQAYRRMIASATYRQLILSPILNGLGLGTVSGNCLWVTVVFARATPPASASKPAAPAGGGPLPQPAGEKPVAVRDAPERPTTTAEAIAKDLFTRVNAERSRRGLAPLEWSDDLARLASDWSGQMARTGRFVHRDLDAARSRPGIGQFSALGENIAWVRGYESDGYELHVGWMRSEGHRRNLLQPGFDTIGIGVVCAGGRAWATENFGRLSASAPPLSDATPPADPIVATAKDGRSC